MTRAGLAEIYRGYIACLNRQDWPSLSQFVHEDVRYNGKLAGLSGYREMLEADFRAIPDLFFDIELLITEPPRAASRGEPRSMGGMLHGCPGPAGEVYRKVTSGPRGRC